MKAGRGPYASALDDGLVAPRRSGSRPNRRLRASSRRPATIAGDLSRVHPTAVSRLGCRADWPLAAPHPRFETCDRTGGSSNAERAIRRCRRSIWPQRDASCGSASRISATTSSSSTTPGTARIPGATGISWDRVPPYDIAATAVPALGAYDSRDTHVLEQHARWIVESGAGAIDVSWWGRGGYEEQSVPRLMDVMRDYGLKVTFHLEPVRQREDRQIRIGHSVSADRVW